MRTQTREQRSSADERIQDLLASERCVTVVERLSDTRHLRIAEDDVLTEYLPEIPRA